MKYIWIPVLASLGWIAVMFLASGLIVALGIIVCWLAALLTLAGCWACVKAYRNPAIQTESNAPITRGRLWLGIGIAVPVMLGCVGVALGALSRIRMEAKTPITAANLRGIGQALMIYVKQYGENPADLATLIQANICTEGSFESFGDPQPVVYSAAEGLKYCSFVYQPQAGSWHTDPKIMIAYEQQAWTPMQLRLIPTYGRYVLFADGHVRRLDDEAFEAAQREDAARRQVLNRPATGP